MTFSSATHSVTRTSRLAMSIRFRASIHCARLTATDPVERMPTSLNCGWISRRSVSSSLAISASRHSRSRSRTSRQGDSAATEQSSEDAAQQRIAELAANRRGDRAPRRLHHLVSHARLGGFTGEAGFFAFKLAPPLSLQPLGFALDLGGLALCCNALAGRLLVGDGPLTGGLRGDFLGLGPGPGGGGGGGGLLAFGLQDFLGAVAVEQRVIFGADDVGLDQDRPLLRG